MIARILFATTMLVSLGAGPALAADADAEAGNTVG